MLIYIKLGFLGGSDSKESACNAGDPSDSWVRKILWRRDWLPTPVFCLGNPMDRGACRLQSIGPPRVRHDWATEHTHTMCSKPQGTGILRENPVLHYWVEIQVPELGKYIHGAFMNSQRKVRLNRFSQGGPIVNRNLCISSQKKIPPNQTANGLGGRDLIFLSWQRRQL